MVLPPLPRSSSRRGLACTQWSLYLPQVLRMPCRCSAVSLPSLSHLYSVWCSSPAVCLPALSCTGLSGLLFFPDRSLVVSYRTLMFPFLAACSASSANLSMYSLLHALKLFLHVGQLLVSGYSSGLGAVVVCLRSLIDY